MNSQELYNNIAASLRTFGNPYGSYHTRGWGWVNDNNPSERCAIASFIPGNTELEVSHNLQKITGLATLADVVNVPLICKTINLFDYHFDKINDPKQLELELQTLANACNLKYTAPVSKMETAVKDIAELTIA